jgi:hypothetical protein
MIRTPPINCAIAASIKLQRMKDKIWACHCRRSIDRSQQDLQHGKILLARVGASDGRTAQVMKAGIER